MTILKARKLLGKQYSHLSDAEVETRIDVLRRLAESLVSTVINKADTLKVSEKSSHTTTSVFC